MDNQYQLNCISNLSPVSITLLCVGVMSSRNPPSAKSRSSSHRNGAPVRTHNKPVAPVPDGLVAAAPAAEERGVDINQLVHSFIEQTGVMDETLARDFLVGRFCFMSLLCVCKSQLLIYQQLTINS